MDPTQIRKGSFFLRPKSGVAESWCASGARRAVAAHCSALSRRAAAAESAQTAGGAGAVLRPERAENRPPALPERGPWRAERRMGRPHMPLGRGHGREPALAAIACEKSDLVHVHVRGGAKKSIFFYELVPPGRIDGITGAPWRVLLPPVPSEGGVPKSASSGHVKLYTARCSRALASSQSRAWPSHASMATCDLAACL